jgi:hypothetical protein
LPKTTHRAEWKEIWLADLLLTDRPLVIAQLKFFTRCFCESLAKN